MSRQNEPQAVDLLVRNAYVVTMDTERRVLTDGAVAIRNGSIVNIGPDREVGPQFKADRAIDARGALVHPGFIDNHVHLDYHNIRWGSPDGAGWEGSLPAHGDYMGIIDADLEYVSSKLAALELARNGTTCFLEAGGVYNPDSAAAALEEVGIRGMLSDAFVRDIGPPGNAKPDRERAFRILGSQLKRNADPDALVRGVVSVSGMGSVSEELLLAAKAMADENGVVLNQHQSYRQDDAENDDRRFGRHPLVHYAEMGVLGENCTFSHVNIVREDEVAPIVESGMSIAWCPMASMLFAVGGTIRGRHLELYRLGANVALGCDSANWTSAFDVGEQGFIALLTAREKTGEPDALLVEDILEMATVNGARAVGMADELGSIAVGKRADLVIRRQDLPEAWPGLDPVRSAIYSSRSKSVGTVIVNGQVIVEDGHSTQVDEEELFAKSRETSLGIFTRVGRDLPTGRWPRIS